MANFYLIGHGGWQRMSGHAFVTVPANSSITFYTEIGEELVVNQAIAILQAGGVPNRFYSATHGAPNQTLGPLYRPGNAYVALRTAAFSVIARGDRFLWVDRLTTLQQIFNDYPGYEFHWLACSTLA